MPPPDPVLILDETPGSEVDPLVPGFVVEKVIGAGSFGVVVQALQVKLDRVVALKTIPFDRAAHPAASARFEAEAVALARVQHPNVVTVYDAGCHAGRAYIAMELLAGEDLGRRLKRGGPLDDRAAWLVVRQAAAGLAHAAAHGVLHRDVKPANLVLIPPPTGLVHPAGVPMVKVADFGLALVRDIKPAGDRPPGLTGTPMFMAPEAFRGAAHDQRADIYALGVTAYHALAGGPPFAADDIWDVMVKKAHPLPPPPAPVSAESAALVAAMTDPDPDHRVASYDDLFARIDRLACLRGSQLLRIPKAAPPVRSRRRLTALLATAALVAGITAEAVRRAARPTPVPVHYVRGPNSIHLFDGEHVAGWLGTGLSIDEDDDRNTVLTGRGKLTRGFTRMANYRVVVGLDPHKATAVELAVAVPEGPADAPRLVLRVTRDGGAVVGTRSGEAGDFTPVGPAVPYPPADILDGKSPYRELRYEKAGGLWRVFFDGREVAARPWDGRPTRPEVLLVAEGGPVRLLMAEVEELRSATD